MPSDIVSAPGATPAPADAAVTPVDAPAQVAVEAPVVAHVQADIPGSPSADAKLAETISPVVPTTSLISEEVGKTVEAPKPETPPVTETAPAEAPPAVTWSDFTLPEGVKLDDSSLGTFKEVLGGELPPQERGQRLIDMHIAEVQRRDQVLSEHQIQVWNDTQAQWKEAVKADPELGGNRFNTTIQTCISAVNRFGGNEQQRAELLQALDFTGAGNNPAIIRLISNMANRLQEGSPMTQSAAPKPQQTREQKRYNASGAN
jgi:hypothetical protein